MTARPRLAAAVALALALAGCATSPFFRPVGPPTEHAVQAGAGGFALAGLEEAGFGGSAFGALRVVEGGHLLLGGDAGWLRALDADLDPQNRLLYGGRIGGRYMRPLLGDSLWVGAEALLDYHASTGGLTRAPQHTISGVVGLPVVERLLPGVWVYTDLSLGVAIPLHDDAVAPFFGFFEAPLGVAWEALPWLVVVGEGGGATTVNGAYVAIGASVRL